MPLSSEEVSAVETVPVYPESAVGYRQWWVVDNTLEPLTFPPTTASCWHTGITRAVYSRLHSEQAPSQGCQCGLYAWHDLESCRQGQFDIVPISSRKIIPYPNIFCLTGAVAAQGKIMIHHHGFRAEEARVLGLCLNLQPGRGFKYLHPRQARCYKRVLELAAQVALKYQVPLFETIEELQEYSQQFGSPVATQLRPECEYDPSWWPLAD